MTDLDKLDAPPDFDVAAAAERLRTRALADDPVRPADVLAALYLYDAAVRERDELRAAALRVIAEADRDTDAFIALRAALHPETTETGS